MNFDNVTFDDLSHSKSKKTYCDVVLYQVISVIY